jgi:ribosomal-protein-alanine N-acetyltransferase
MGNLRNYDKEVVEMQRLRGDHSGAILSFEILNRAYFAASISDRGDEYFEQFSEQHAGCLAEQDAGTCVYHVLLDQDGTVLGRINLYEVEDRSAVVGYRIAENAAGRGVATSALRELCRVAAEQYGIDTLRAATTNENVASQRVLEKVGFASVGPTDVAGRPGRLYEYVLAPSRS